MRADPKKKRKCPKTPFPPWSFEPIGVMRTAFHDKFGIPRQSGMTPEARGWIELNPHPFYAQACKDLEKFSHIWVLFVFHEHRSKGWKPSIRPPRLGGAKRVGVLASRSPHRPNPIGLSAVKLDHVDLEHPDGARIHVSGVDILDGSPVLDIKPYLPYADVIADANSGWAGEPIPRIPVEYTEKSLRDIAEREKKVANFKTMVHEVLELDPRPASQRRKMPADSPESEGLAFGFTIADYDVKWEIRGGKFLVTAVEDLIDGKPAHKVKGAEKKS